MARRKRSSQDSVGLVPTGSTLLNLACSSNPNGAYRLGTMINAIGDSSAGKSMLCLTMLAELAKQPQFDNHKFIYDDVERRLFFNIPKLFGQSVADRIQGPDGPVSESTSTTLESFYYNMHRLHKQGEPFVYILDSMDALDSESSEKKFQENMDAFQKEKEAKGSYGDGKAKINSSNMRPIIQQLRNSRSLLLIVSQTRDNIGLGFAPKTRAGGRALEFYAAHIFWLAKTGKIKKNVRGKDRTIGVNVRAKVTKNSITGRQVEVDFPLYFSYGLDDIESMVDFLLSEKEWKKTQGKISGDIFGDQTIPMSRIVSYIEENDLEADVRELCRTIWLDIEKQLQPERKPRYE